MQETQQDVYIMVEMLNCTGTTKNEKQKCEKIDKNGQL